ncbi:uncharacterized protein LOC143475146 [Brachyhypopomus gauderio]|uniref:uncharacterized protein LOC143475146 n=1 Tax=Brachyhypopomus gauderio TaxID=698409 RepID=UPI0040428C2C
MMWWSRRFWLLLTAILTLRDAESYREWNKNPVHHSYDVPELAYVDQPEKVTYLPYQAYLEDFSVASMQGSSVTFQQDLESDEVGQLRWDPSSEMGSSKLLVEEEPLAYQSMFQGGEGFPGVLTESQMLGSSGNSERLFEGQTFESVPSTPEFSRSFFQEGYLSQGSLDDFDSYNGQGFPSPYTGAWVDETHVQSDPIYEGNYRAPYMGQSMYIPSEMHHPFKGVNSPSRHQGHPQRHVHPLHSWPVSKPPSFLPQVKVSLSSLAGDKPDLQQSAKGSQQSGSRPPYGDHSWVGSTDGSQMWGSTTSHHTGRNDAHSSHSFPGHAQFQNVHKGKAPGPVQPSKPHVHSHKQGPGVTTSSHHTGRDDAHGSPSFPGHAQSQNLHEGKPSGLHLHSEPQGHSHMPGTGMTSSSHQTGMDAHKSHGFPGHVNPQVMHESKPSGSHRHSEQQGHSHMPGTGMTSSSHQTGVDAHKSHGFPGHVNPQVMHESKPSGSHRHSEQQGHSHMPGTGMTSSIHQTATDDAHKSHGFPGHVNPQVMHESKPSGLHLHSEPQGHSHMPGTGMTSSSHQTGMDAHKSHGFPGHVNPQVMHESKPSGSHRHSEQQGHSHMPGTGMTSSIHQTATDDAHKSHGFPGHVNPQVMHESKPSGSHRHSEQQGHSHMPGTGMTSSIHQTATDDAHKSHGFPAHVNSQVKHESKPSGLHLHSEQQGHSHMPGTGMTSSSHQTGTVDAHKSHSVPGHSKSQHVQTGKPSHHFPPSRPSARTLMWGSGLTSHQTGSDIAPWIHSRYGHLHS